MPDRINIFNDLEDHVDGVLEELNKMLPKANSELMDLFTELYYDLDKSNSTTIDASVDNLNKINKFRSRIEKVLDEGSYSDAVTGYLQGYTASSKYINQYFGSIVNSFKANDQLYKAILQSNINSTSTSLLDSGVSANFTDPILDILRKNVTSGSNKADFIKTLEANLDDETGILSRYVKQVASDSITQFNSNYIGTISNDLGLKYYYYKGTKIADTRPFCARAAGKYFTEAQLKAYVQQQAATNGGKGWAGMVKGENWSNFMIYRGGYSCRHYVIPVSKEIYDAAPATAKWAA